MLPQIKKKNEYLYEIERAPISGYIQSRIWKILVLEHLKMILNQKIKFHQPCAGAIKTATWFITWVDFN